MELPHDQATPNADFRPPDAPEIRLAAPTTDTGKLGRPGTVSSKSALVSVSQRQKGLQPAEQPGRFPQRDGPSLPIIATMVSPSSQET
jgi:hypothetical protein